MQNIKLRTRSRVKHHFLPTFPWCSSAAEHTHSGTHPNIFTYGQLIAIAKIQETLTYPYIAHSLLAELSISYLFVTQSFFYREHIALYPDLGIIGGGKYLFLDRPVF